MTGAVEPGAVAADFSANDCGNDFRNALPARASSAPVPTPDPHQAERATTFSRGCDPTASAATPPPSPVCVCTAARRLPTPADQPLTESERKVRLLRRKTVRSGKHGAPIVAGPLTSSDLEAVVKDELDATQGASRVGRLRSARSSDAEAAESPSEIPRCARSAHAFPAKAVPSRGRRTDAELSTATSPTSGQRVGSVEQPRGCSRRALLVGAPQGPKDFGERSDAKVYGATPFVAAKETTTLPKVHWGGGRSRGNGSPSGESPKASWGAATKSMHPTIDVERGEA